MIPLAQCLQNVILSEASVRVGLALLAGDAMSVCQGWGARPARVGHVTSVCAELGGQGRSCDVCVAGLGGGQGRSCDVCVCRAGGARVGHVTSVWHSRSCDMTELWGGY